MEGVRSKKKRPNPKPAAPSRRALTEDEADIQVSKERMKTERFYDWEDVKREDDEALES